MADEREEREQRDAMIAEIEAWVVLYNKQEGWTATMVAKYCGWLIAALRSSEAALVEARRDTDRLDWLDSRGELDVDLGLLSPKRTRVIGHYAIDIRIRWQQSGNADRPLRELLDVARSLPEKTE